MFLVLRPRQSVGSPRGGSRPAFARLMISFMPLTACFKFGHAGPYDMRSLSMYGLLWKRRRWKGFTSKKMPGTQMTLCLTQYSKRRRLQPHDLPELPGAARRGSHLFFRRRGDGVRVDDFPPAGRPWTIDAVDSTSHTVVMSRGRADSAARV